MPVTCKIYVPVALMRCQRDIFTHRGLSLFKVQVGDCAVENLPFGVIIGYFDAFIVYMKTDAYLVQK